MVCIPIHAFTLLSNVFPFGTKTDWCVEAPEAGEKEQFTSWALFILIMLLIAALITSYLLQQKRIQAVHETVISIFAGWWWLALGLSVEMLIARDDRWIDRAGDSRDIIHSVSTGV